MSFIKTIQNSPPRYFRVLILIVFGVLTYLFFKNHETKFHFLIILFFTCLTLLELFKKRKRLIFDGVSLLVEEKNILGTFQNKFRIPESEILYVHFKQVEYDSWELMKRPILELILPSKAGLLHVYLKNGKSHTFAFDCVKQHMEQFINILPERLPNE
jgi:hypothetical protein